MKAFLAPGIAVCFLLFIFSISSFPPTLTEITSRLTSVAIKSFDFPLENYPLASFFGALFPKSILFSYQWHRLIPISLGVVSLVLFSLILQKTNTSSWSLIMLVVSPWFIKLSLFDLTGICTFALMLCLILLKLNSRSYLSLLIIPLLGLASLAGTIFSIIFALFYTFENIKANWRLGILGLTAVVVVLALPGRFINIYQQISTTFDYSLPRAGFDVDQRIRLETRINNYQDIIPIMVKRLAYNKWFFIMQKLELSVFNLLNWDKLFAPTQQDVTVAKSLWGETGFISLFYWQAIVIVMGLFFWKNIPRAVKTVILICLISGIISAAFYPGSEFELGGLAMLISLGLLAGAGMQILAKNKFVFCLFLLIAVTGMASTYDYFVVKYLDWSDNRAFVMYNTVKLADQYQSSTIVISNLIGPEQYYYAWENNLESPNSELSTTSFRNFELFSNNTPSPGIYIGFPGQFLGNQVQKNMNDFSATNLPDNMHLLSSFKFVKHVSYGNGDQIWAVQVN